MAKRKKHDPEDEAKPKPPPKVGTSLGAMLKGVTLEKAQPKPKKPAANPAPAPTRVPTPIAPPAPTAARPSDTLVGGERSIYYEAMRGVRRIDAGQKPRAGRVVASPPPKPDAAETERDDEARARLRSLVGGGARFDVRQDDDYIEGCVVGTPESVMRQLLKASPGAPLSLDLPCLDLHGAREHEVEARVSRFVRAEHKKGAKRLLIVHGKGLHSGPARPQGRSGLGRASVTALTAGGAAPVVRAFVSAPAALGGTGALLVELR